MKVYSFTIFHKGWEKCEEETKEAVSKKKKISKTGYQKMIQSMEWQEGLFYGNFCGKGLNVASEKKYTIMRELTSEKIRK